MTTDLKYPIGRFAEQPLAQEKKYAERVKILHLRDISQLPSLLEHSVANLDQLQLHTPYRPDGWTIQQVVHHVADSHMNAYMRFKLALTEDHPTIRPYDEKAWALLSDTQHTPVNISFTLLHALHVRWMELMTSLTETQWERTYYHPAQDKSVTLWNTLALYAWHGKHHQAHITSLRARMGW